MLWLGRRFAKQLRPGVMFGAWLVWAGVGRFLAEFFRPDQPRIPGTGTSYSQVIYGLMALGGLLFVAVKYEKIKLPFISAEPKKYKLSRR
jgi:phosphatidylglycerol:prolipoprotein diacylglycerol transferase